MVVKWLFTRQDVLGYLYKVVGWRGQNEGCGQTLTILEQCRGGL